MPAATRSPIRRRTQDITIIDQDKRYVYLNNYVSIAIDSSHQYGVLGAGEVRGEAAVLAVYI